MPPRSRRINDNGHIVSVKGHSITAKANILYTSSMRFVQIPSKVLLEGSIKISDIKGYKISEKMRKIQTLLTINMLYMHIHYAGRL